MNIDLYYVEGISRIDTPSFNTKNHIGTIQDQEDFFLTKKVKTVEITFYPPHYRDQIKFDKEDLVITDNVNYLSFVYGTKTYYYFIDKINYTSTGVILLDISMDVIQTYMFDTYISSGIIERKFIDRWLLVPGRDNFVLRNYLRENVSNGIFSKLETKTYVNSDIRHWFIVGLYTKRDKENTVYNKNPYSIIDNVDSSDDTLNFIDIPYNIKICPLHNYLGMIDPHTQQDVPFNPGGFIGTTAYLAESRDLFICPFNLFGDAVTYNDDINKIYFHSSGIYNSMVPEYFNFDSMHGEEVPTVTSGTGAYRTVYVSQEVDFDFIPSTNVGNLFSSRFVPALLDENYIRLEFGTNNCNTTFPLYQLGKTYIYCKYGCNLGNGTRFYYITEYPSSNKDEWNTMVIDANIMSIDLKNDAWAQYISSNKNRWAMLTASSLLGASETMVRVGSSSKYNEGDIKAILENPSSYTPKRGLLSSKAKKQINDVKNASVDTTGQMMLAGTMGRAVGGIVNQVYLEDNLIHTPPTVKQTGSYSTIGIGKSAYIYYKIVKVIDFEQCAQYYHRNGYLVNEYVTQVSNIFNTVKNRYYFDMLKMSIPEVHLHNVIEDEDTIGLIEERLEQGLRLWNVLNQDVIIGDFTYDNVEYSYLV